MNPTLYILILTLLSCSTPQQDYSGWTKLNQDSITDGTDTVVLDAVQRVEYGVALLNKGDTL